MVYSVSEASRVFLSCLTSIFSTGSNGRSESHKQGFKIWWTDSTEEKLQTNMCSSREIDLKVKWNIKLICIR